MIAPTITTIAIGRTSGAARRPSGAGLHALGGARRAVGATAGTAAAASSRPTGLGMSAVAMQRDDGATAPLISERVGEAALGREAPAEDLAAGEHRRGDLRADRRRRSSA